MEVVVILVVVVVVAAAIPLSQYFCEKAKSVTTKCIGGSFQDDFLDCIICMALNLVERRKRPKKKKRIS